MQVQKNIAVDGRTHAEIAKLAHEGQRSLADQVRFLVRFYKRETGTDHDKHPCSNDNMKQSVTHKEISNA